MAKLGTVTFTGQSGQEYVFTVYSRDTEFKALGAVYFMTTRQPDGKGGVSHTRIYVGETGDLSDRPLNHERKPCFDRNGANCVCLLLEEDYEKRCAVELDIRRNCNPPCNRE
jgi:hypothetical protein